MRTRFLTLVGLASGIVASGAIAAPVTYAIDPAHTYPSFDTDHMGGLSKWRGKFNATSGTITLDKEAQTGSVEIQIDTASVDFGHQKMNDHVKSPDMLDVAKHPTATYTGKLVKFKNGAPTEVQGTLTLRGISKPVTLQIKSFMCKPNPRSGKEACGADAYGKFDRSDFGVDYGKQYGFLMDIGLQIQVEASPVS